VEHLTIVELTALVKLAEKAQKAALAEGQEVSTGNHAFRFTVQLDGNLSRGTPTKVTPTFSLEKYLRPLFLKYASSLGDADGRRWLQSIMSSTGALAAVIQLGADAVLRTIDPALIAVWDNSEAEAKARFQQITPKTDRGGNTVVAGGIQKV